MAAVAFMALDSTKKGNLVLTVCDLSVAVQLHLKCCFKS